MAIRLSVVLVVATVLTVSADEPVVIRPVLTTAPLLSYEDAPATPDADDPAIWLNRHKATDSLIIGTAKDAGLVVYDLSGRLVQALLPSRAPHVSPVDPPTPAGPNPKPDSPCLESASHETFGRYNNVAIAYDIRFGAHRKARLADVAVVSDRGCDRIRFFRIDPTDPNGPLVDITAADAPRVFPERYDQPSHVQPSGGVEGWFDNPVDDQNTVYGLTIAEGLGNAVFVSQRERGLVRQLRLTPRQDGTLTYSVERTFLFDTSFELRNEAGTPYAWTPCREAIHEEPQSEGLVFDSENKTLFVAFETIGLYRIPFSHSLPSFVRIGVDRLIEPVTTFGRAYRAIPDEDEFACEYGDTVAATADVEAPGSDVHAGTFLEADLEGLSIIAAGRGETLMLASSQGDSSFHLYLLEKRKAHHLSSFLVDGVGETDGVDYVPMRFGRRYPAGLLVVQNGAAPEPPDTGDINGYEFDGATQFKYVSFLDVLTALRRD